MVPTEDLVWQLPSLQPMEAKNKSNTSATENLVDVLHMHNEIHTIIFFQMYYLLVLQVNSPIFYRRITAQQKKPQRKKENVH